MPAAQPAAGELGTDCSGAPLAVPLDAVPLDDVPLLDAGAGQPVELPLPLGAAESLGAVELVAGGGAPPGLVLAVPLAVDVAVEVAVDVVPAHGSGGPLDPGADVVGPGVAAVVDAGVLVGVGSAFGRPGSTGGNVAVMPFVGTGATTGGIRMLRPDA